MRTPRNWPLLLVVVFLAGTVTTAVANHSTDTPSYTGCLKQDVGTISKLKQGSNPRTACDTGEVSIHLSAGDITGIVTATGSGIIGGRAKGEASLQLDYPLLDARYVNTDETPAGMRDCSKLIFDEFADLSYCNLDGMVLTGKRLLDVDFRHASLRNASPTNVFMSGDMRYLDLSGTTFTTSGFITLNFHYGNLSGTSMDGMGFNVDTTHAIGVNASFEGTTMRGSFFDVDFTGASFVNAGLLPMRFTKVNFTDANLTGARIEERGVRNITWGNTTCPDGTNSDTNGDTCIGHFALP